MKSWQYRLQVTNKNTAEIDLNSSAVWNGFVTNLICLPAVQNFWKSAKIWQSNKSLKWEVFWDTVYIEVCSCILRIVTTSRFTRFYIGKRTVGLSEKGSKYSHEWCTL